MSGGDWIQQLYLDRDSGQLFGKPGDPPLFGTFSRQLWSALGVPYLVPNDETLAAQNTANIQAVLDAGGKRLSLLTPGIIYVSKTFLLPSIFEVYLGPGVELTLAANSNCNMFRNRAAGVLMLSTQFVRFGNVVTVREDNHPRKVGEQVRVSQLTVDTSFNGLQTITATTQNSWSYTSIGANGSPSNLAFVNPAYEQLVAAGFASVSNLVTVTQPGHTKQAGDAIHIENLTGNTSFNGNFQVSSSVAGVSWTYVKTGVDTASTGTAVIQADSRIWIQGPGKINGNEQAQTSDNSFRGTSAQRAVIFGNISKSGLYGNTRWANVWINIIWIFNSSDILADGAYYEGTHGDGVHFEFPYDRVLVRRQYGSTSDDMVAFTNTDSSTGGYTNYASPSGLGNAGTAIVEDIYPSNSPTPAVIKWTSQGGYNAKALICRRIGGSLSSIGLSGIAIIDDTSGLTGGTLDYLELDTFSVTGGSTSSRMLLLAQTGTIKKIRLANLIYDPAFLGSQMVFTNNVTTTVETFIVDNCRNNGQLGVTQDVFLLNGPITVNDFQMVNCAWNGNAGLGNVITQQNSSVIRRLYLNNVTFNEVSSPFRQNGSGTVDVILCNNMRALNCAVVWNTVGSMTIYLTNVVMSGTANNDFQIGGGTVRIIGKNMSTTSPGKTLLLGFGTISYNCPDREAGLDLGNPAVSPAGVAPFAGDQIFNTNANVAAQGLTGRTAAGTWVRVF